MSKSKIDDILKDIEAVIKKHGCEHAPLEVIGINNHGGVDYTSLRVDILMKDEAKEGDNG